MTIFGPILVVFGVLRKLNYKIHNGGSKFEAVGKKGRNFMSCVAISSSVAFLEKNIFRRVMHPLSA